jgi:hypothetical protein
LLLKFKPVNLDVLPLYIVLMGLFPPVLWICCASPTGPCWPRSRWLAARQFDWNLGPIRPAPGISIRIAGRCSSCSAHGARSAAHGNMNIINSPVTLYFCIAYLILGLVMTMAGKFPAFGEMFPHWLYSTFNPNDKTDLAPYRFLHFVVIVIIVIRFIPKDWPALEWKISIP